MEPLRVQARLDGPVALPTGSIALDALLAAAVAIRDELPPAATGEWTPIQVPLQLEPAGRFHLASFALFVWETRELRRINQRFPLAEAQERGDASLRRVELSAGPTRSYRLPLSTGHAAGDELEWFAFGDGAGIQQLLALIGYIGKKRSVGYGRVREWTVEQVEPWGPDFPVVREGRPLRPLPPEWPGLVAAPIRVGRLTYPYWASKGRCVIAWPEVPE